MANEVQKLSAKLNSLLWVPSGEIDDTRFEKLLDGLQSTCLVDDYSINHHQGPQGLKCLLQQNTLDIIHVRPSILSSLLSSPNNYTFNVIHVGIDESRAA